MSGTVVSHSLLEAFKERMVIDYTDKDSDLVRLLEESEEEIERLVGSKDISNQSVRSLVLARARYAFNGQEEFFYENFQQDILGLSLTFYQGGKEDAESKSHL